MNNILRDLLEDLDHAGLSRTYVENFKRTLHAHWADDPEVAALVERKFLLIALRFAEQGHRAAHNMAGHALEIAGWDDVERHYS